MVRLENISKSKVFQSPKNSLNWLALIGKPALWTVSWLVLMDVALNLLFPFPRNPDQMPSSFQRYFDYGRSIVGKLERMVPQNAEDSPSILEAGWIDPESETWQAAPTSPGVGDDLLVSVYGMSFANQAGRALAEVDGNITVRLIAGPGAPPNHSFAAYMADTAGRDADVAILGILASSVQRMRSISGMNWTYAFPAPYTYPYYTVDPSGNLIRTDPVITTAEEFVEAFNQKDENWTLLKSQMRDFDQPFDPFIFSENLLDHSAIVRLIRRGWAGQVHAENEDNFYNPATGFNPEAGELQALELMLTEFVTTAESAGQMPIVLLFNNQGYQAHLYELLSDHVKDLSIPLVSTHEILPPDDPSNFISDGHFTPEANLKIGEALRQVIRR